MQPTAAIFEIDTIFLSDSIFEKNSATPNTIGISEWAGPEKLKNIANEGLKICVPKRPSTGWCGGLTN